MMAELLNINLYRYAPLTLLVISLLVVSGCKQEEKLGRISGKVTFQGQPISGGTILFNCMEKGVNMTTVVRPDGSYEITMAKGAGLPTGTYNVSISPPQISAKIGEPQPTRPKQYPNIPAKYRNYQTSGLTVTIKDGDNPFDIDMKP